MKVIKNTWNMLKQLDIINLFVIFLAGCINAVGVIMFLAPVKIYDSGISGTSMLLWMVTPEHFTLPFFLILLNLPLFIFGWKKQGAVFTLYSIWAVCIYSIASYVIANVIPVDVTNSSPFAGQDLILCAIFGGLISGIGSGLTIRFGGAIDGIEVLAVIFAKRLGITVGIFVMIYNIALYIIIGSSFRSWILPLYSIITYCAAIKTVDFIVEGLDKAKSVMIITTKREEVCQALSETFERGVTQMDATGYYSNEEKSVIYFVVNRFQIARLKSIISQIDAKAFVTISEVSDMMGRSVNDK